MSRTSKTRLKTSGTIAVGAVLVATLLAAQQKADPHHDDLKDAEALIHEGRLNEAKSATLQELQLHPSNVDGYNLLGIIATDQQDYSGAVAAFKKAPQIAPNSVKTHNNLGNAYAARKNFDQAE